MSHAVAAIALWNLLIPTAPAEQTVVSSAAGTRAPTQALSPSDWSGIRAAYEAGRHAVTARNDGHHARNPGQQWRTPFDGRGFLVTPHAGIGLAAASSAEQDRPSTWSWGLELVSLGRAGDERPVPVAPMCIDADRQRVEYKWNEGLTEWYINDPRGLEHGYTVYKRPDFCSGVCHRSVSNAGAADAASYCWHSRGKLESKIPLQLSLAIRGELRPLVSPDGRSVQFIDNSGTVVVNQSGLTVFDADGHPLPAHFEPDDHKLKLTIDDTNARYPLTVEPIAQQAYLKPSNIGTMDQFGWTVAASGDTVVVRAYLEDSIATGVNGNQASNTSADAGAAYVFLITPDCPAAHGDANCDAAIDFFDIDPFLQALFDPPAYAAAFCGGSTCTVDVDCSGSVDFFDIDPFLTCLFDACPPCP